MLKRIIIGAALGCLLWSGTALASEFDGWSVRQITSHADFVRSDESLSSARNHGGPRAKRVYHWIGYIPVGEQRVYFTRFGEPLTCVVWERTGEWVPEWALAALESLESEGYIVLDGAPAEGEAEPETIAVEGRG